MPVNRTGKEAHVDRAVHEYENRVVRHLNEEFARSASRGDRFADWVAARVGSWAFILSQSLILITWMAWNLMGPASMRFDPAPFIGLNLLLSFQAAYTAPFIMMSANRSQQREHMEAEIDFAVNYYAETEIADMQGDLHDLRRRLSMIEEQNRELTAQNRQLLTLVQDLAKR